jgi:hypothetical protein
MDMKFGRTSLFIWIVFLWLVMCLEVGLLLYPHPGGIGRVSVGFLVLVPFVFLLKRFE